MKYFRYKVEFFQTGLYEFTLDRFQNTGWDLVAFFPEPERYVAIFKQEVTAAMAATPA